MVLCLPVRIPSVSYTHLDCIINHRLKKIDVGYCNFYDGNEHQRRYFLNAVNIGLGARIVKITDQTKRFWGVKFLSYVAADVYKRQVIIVRFLIHNRIDKQI